MREQIINWYRNNNNHALDDNRFFDIVISSIEQKIDYSTFENALHYENENITDDEIDDIYKRYEYLYAFLTYYDTL